MERYEAHEDQGIFYILDNKTGEKFGMGEAAHLLNEAISLEERNEMANFVKHCDDKLKYDLLDKTLEILMTPIMETETKDMVDTVEQLSRGSNADNACANLLRRAIYLKALAESDQT